MRIIAYTYESDYHCPECTQKRFPALPGNKEVDEHGVSVNAMDSEGNLLQPVFDLDATPAATSCSDCKAEITKPLQLDAWKTVRKLWAQWKYYEAAERAYDCIAARGAYDDYSKAATQYEKTFFMKWELNDIFIEIRGGSFQEAHNLSEGQRCVIIDHDNME